ncbi:alpha-1,2-fucosyltransferase [Bacteroides sp. OttesenSCG-928-F21]|nr:alpha-1,2-fucosyltransferase [Bacteroides sp. OttesenSCG-928-F21]
MKIICDAPGQTCNRLWSYIASISECVVRKKRMVILFYDYTITDFPNLRNCKFIYFPLYHPWYLNRGNGWNKFKGLTWKATHNKNMDKIYKFLGFTVGWNTRRETRYIVDAKKEIIKIFTPKKEITDQVQNLFSTIKANSDLIVGVHIRRGDYKTWHDGRFFFSLSEYYEFMKRISALYPDKKTAFFISSNEEFDVNMFSELQCYRITNPISITSDLYALSQCDLITGPPSTFSRWASFYGEKPLSFLYSTEQNISKESFSPMVDFFHLANGEEIFDW